MQQPKVCNATSKKSTATLKKHPLQHRKIMLQQLQTSQSITNAISEKKLFATEKIPLQHSQIACCNTEKEPFQQTRELNTETSLEP